jgi:carbamoyltransferase
MSKRFRYSDESVNLIVGLGGAARHGCVAISDGQEILGICEQERVTRVRDAGFNATGLPDEALDLLLSRAGRNRGEIARYASTRDYRNHDLPGLVCIDHHHALACTAYLSSPFAEAVVVVCDDASPKVSVWTGNGPEITRVEWPWSGLGFSDLYSLNARLLGFESDQRFEALARLDPDYQDERLENLFKTDGASLDLETGWQARVTTWIQAESAAPSPAISARYAAGLQRRVAELLLTFLSKVGKVTQPENLCLGGTLFSHSSINTFVRTSGLFERVFVPVNPGDAGLALGTVLHESGCAPAFLSPFRGPAYSPHEIKTTLENCKLPYSLVSESEAVEIAVHALRNGRLVGWFEGAMEWGPRALGGRSILANPLAPFALENLNQFLKHRPPWRGYGLSILESAASEHFSGPSGAPFMECDFRPHDPHRFQQVLPSAKAGIRVHMAGQHSPPGFLNLLEAFGAASGIPCVVNTSFNGFLEPIVCSPRDAIRVFYGSGVDVLVLGRFVLTK